MLKLAHQYSASPSCTLSHYMYHGVGIPRNDDVFRIKRHNERVGLRAFSCSFPFPPSDAGRRRWCFCRYDAPPPPMASSSLVRIAVVGDVHGLWNLEEDRMALQLLQPHLVLFTGDFGEENVPLVQSVSLLPFPKAVILGNHDAWYTHDLSRQQNGVQMQLDVLGDEHVGYRRLDFPSLKLSIVGGRPFSHGGDQLFRKKLLVRRYGVVDMDSSAGRICSAVQGTPDDHLVVILAHNGPTGLGSQAEDVCGKDWDGEGGDHGDPDLEQAICQLKETTSLPIPLVVFGHMHKVLQSRKGSRKMVVEGSDKKTLYLNGAIVPRVKRTKVDDHCHDSLSGFMRNEKWKAAAESEGESTARAFTVVEILDGIVEKIAETWVHVDGSNARIVEEETLYLYRNVGGFQPGASV